MQEINTLCDRVRQIAYEIHVYHANGHLEKVYENSLVNRLRKAGIQATQQTPIVVRDEDGTALGNYFADILVEGRLLIELKAAKALAPEHEAQVLAYLKATGLEHALLINFGAFRFEIRKFALTRKT